MSTVIAKNVQIGTSVTATDNFTIFQPATPDGTLRIGNGNTGITSSFVSMSSAGNVGIGTTSTGFAKLTVRSGTGTAHTILGNDYGSLYLETASGGPNRITSLNSALNSGQALAFNGSGGTEWGRFDTSGNFQFNSGYGSVATAYGCRAWINFNGTGTPAIRGSGNVSSITDNGTGDYTLNFTTSLPDTNYCPVVGGDFSQGATRDNGMYLPTNFTFATSSLRISVTNYAGAYTDIDTVLVSIFR